MLADDAEAYAYYEEVKGFPFIPGVQGEGLSDEQYMEKNGIWFPSMSTRSSRPTILYNHFE